MIDSRASTLPAPPIDYPQWPKRAACGTELSPADWSRLPDPKPWALGEDGIVFEQRLCSCGCGSHLLVQIAGPWLDDERC